MPAEAASPKPLPREWWFSAWQIEDEVWPHSRGAGVTVGIVDTGVEATMPELDGVVVAGTDFDGGDGRVETHPTHHGTALAQLIAAQGTGSGMLGIAPEAKILPVAISTVNEIKEGIRYAADNGAQVINVSTAGGAARNQTTSCSPPMQEAVSYAIERDAVVVASAGNTGDEDNFPEEPANCAGVLAVGALDNEREPWQKTQRQPYVSVAAPGVDIVSRTPPPYNEFVANTGTSMAAALASGAVALVRAKFPDMPAREVVRRVIASARDSGPPGYDKQTGYGAMRPAQALTGDVPANAANPVFDRYDQWKATIQQEEAQQRDDARRVAVATTVRLIVLLGVPLLLVLAVVGLLILRRRRTAPATTRAAPRRPPMPGGYVAPQHPGQRSGQPPPPFGPQWPSGRPPQWWPPPDGTQGPGARPPSVPGWPPPQGPPPQGPPPQGPPPPPGQPPQSGRPPTWGRNDR